jgi:hypothetical protein
MIEAHKEIIDKRVIDKIIRGHEKSGHEVITPLMERYYIL